jgi:hypothetical protein
MPSGSRCPRQTRQVPLVVALTLWRGKFAVGICRPKAGTESAKMTLTAQNILTATARCLERILTLLESVYVRLVHGYPNSLGKVFAFLLLTLDVRR